MIFLRRTNGAVFPLQVVLLDVETSKVSMLLGTFDLKPDVGQKTVIITSSPQEAEHVFMVTWPRDSRVHQTPCQSK